MSAQFRVTTYNVHKCRGLDRKTSPQRIAKVLIEIDADIIALQEILHLPESGKDVSSHDQLNLIAVELNRHFASDSQSYSICFGENRRLKNGAPYGNAVLTRVPLVSCENYHLPQTRRERRGCLRVDLKVPQRKELLHFFNVHLGTGLRERRVQAENLVSQAILRHSTLQGSRLIAGDFNEWLVGRTTRLLKDELESVDLKRYMRRRKTYPGIFPLLHLDHIYYDRELVLRNFRVHRSRAALVASDHLPLVAEFATS
jgi:endonuclease/exonuclease/phosphatase family metal-dependent hydrolase